MNLDMLLSWLSCRCVPAQEVQVAENLLVCKINVLVD